LHGIRTVLTVLLHFPPDTVLVIQPIRQKVPMKLAAGSTALVDLACPVFASSASPALSSAVLQAPRIHAPGLLANSPSRRVWAEAGRYCLRLAESVADREAACRLRFKVFNIELGEGLESSYRTGLDTDQFDLFCEHLIVEDKLESNPARRVVGTYRMQSGAIAARNLGYYSEQEFDFSPYEPLREGILELGRASIDREHRTPEVLTLLWRGIAQYATDMGLRYLIGCSSLTSKNPSEGWQMYRQLDHYRVLPELGTVPTAAYACPSEPEGAKAQTPPRRQEPSMPTAVPSPLNPPQFQVKVPKLLRTYLAIGARISGPPAWDREFGTIDFLTLLDLKLLSPSARNRFLAPLSR
jgi:putative hemolysin